MRAPIVLGVAWLGLGMAVSGCPFGDDPDPGPTIGGHGIGTWPTPENRQPVGAETCDGEDNDGDGSIDEGCACSSDRSCTAMPGGQCVAGTQDCYGGTLLLCVADAGGGAMVSTASIEITSTTPTALTQNTLENLDVVVRVETPCSAITIPAVRLSLAALDPKMTVIAEALDNGVAPDLVAADGNYTGSIVHPFGLGVAPQTLTLRAQARIAEQALEDSRSVTMGAP